ncbi:methyltransferase family protein [Candidatus Aquicultor sp.]
MISSTFYKYIRHPLYGSLLFLVWGIVFKHLSVIGIVITLIATLSLVGTAKVEKRENTQRFGSAYTEYMKATHMFIPFVW